MRFPSESTFSRAFAEFPRMPASRVHEALIKKHHSEKLVGHISRDSTAVEAREKVCAEAKKKAKEMKAAESAKKASEKQQKGQTGTPKKGESAPPKEKPRLEKQKTMNFHEMMKDIPKGVMLARNVIAKGTRELERLQIPHRYG